MQTYVRNPLLIDGLKFDFRIYILVTSCAPLRVYIFKEGLARFATKPYVKPNDSNIDNAFMHLTNYSLNKFSEDFVPAAVGSKEAEGDLSLTFPSHFPFILSHFSLFGAGSEGEGGEGAAAAGAAEPAPEVDESKSSKRTIAWVMNWLNEQGHDADACWERIGTMLNKTLIAIQPKLAHAYRTCFSGGDSDNNCFEILGFDVLLDQHLKPWLIEVNHSPSFNTDSLLDEVCKNQLVADTLKLVGIKASSKKNYVKQLRKEFAARNLSEHRSTEHSLQHGHTVEGTVAMARMMNRKAQQHNEEEAKRIAHEDKNSGDYTRIYPPPILDTVDGAGADLVCLSAAEHEKQPSYQRFFAGATMIFTGEFSHRDSSEATSDRIARLLANEEEDSGEEDSPVKRKPVDEEVESLLQKVESLSGVSGRVKMEAQKPKLMDAGKLTILTRILTSTHDLSAVRTCVAMTVLRMPVACLVPFRYL